MEDEVASDLWAFAQSVWNQEREKVESTSVAIGKLIGGAHLCSLDSLSCAGSAVFWGRRLPKLGIDEASLHVIEPLSVYRLRITFVLTAPRYA